jgi:hypothetical protein
VWIFDALASEVDSLEENWFDAVQIRVIGAHISTIRSHFGTVIRVISQPRHAGSRGRSFL